MSEFSGFVVEGTLYSADGKGMARERARYQASVSEVWASLTELERLAGWFGNVSGDLRTGGEFAAFVHASEWDGRGHVDECNAQRRLIVRMWEEEGKEHRVAAELTADDDHTILQLQVNGVPLEFVWAYGAGWHEHLEDLGSHLEGRNRSASSSDSRFDEFAESYREMGIVPL